MHGEQDGAGVLGEVGVNELKGRGSASREPVDRIQQAVGSRPSEDDELTQSRQEISNMKTPAAEPEATNGI